MSVHAYIINKNGDFLMQKRSHLKKFRPLEWDFTGGAVCSGEDSRSAIKIEIFEELAIEVNEDSLYYLFSLKRESVFIDVFCYFTKKGLSEMKLQRYEINMAKFVSRSELIKIAEKNKEKIYRSFDHVSEALKLIDLK